MKRVSLAHIPTSAEATWLARATPWYPDAKDDDMLSDDALSSSKSVTSAARSSSIFGPRRLKDADDFDAPDQESMWRAGDLQDDSFLTFSIGAGFGQRRKYSSIRYARYSRIYQTHPLRRDHRPKYAKKRYSGPVARFFDVAKCFS